MENKHTKLIKGNYITLQHMFTCACEECTVSSPLVSSLEVEHLCLELLGESLVPSLLHC